jgi:hypothetical protein
VKRTRYIASLLAFIFLLSGCSSLWEREVYMRSPHIAPEDADLSGATLTVNSYATLRNAIIGVIRDGESEADIRVTDYPGGLTSLSVAALLNEIQTDEPIGAYTVDFMAFDLNPVLSQHILSLNIVYRHEVRPPITPVSGRRGLEEAVHSLLNERRSLLTVEMRYFYARDHDAESMIRAFYYGNPGWAMEYPGVSVTLYPPSGGDRSSLSRIVEAALDWQTPAYELERKSFDTEAHAIFLLSEMPVFTGSAEETDAQAVLWLYETLRDTVQVNREAGEPSRGDAYTAYGALVRGDAVSEGAAMAFKLLCDMLDINALVVTGYYRGGEHAWNLVRLGDTWYHVAVVPGIFLQSDESEAMESFHWTEAHYPSAPAGPWTEEDVRWLDFAEED